MDIARKESISAVQRKLSKAKRFRKAVVGHGCLKGCEESMTGVLGRSEYKGYQGQKKEK